MDELPRGVLRFRIRALCTADRVFLTQAKVPEGKLVGGSDLRKAFVNPAESRVYPCLLFVGDLRSSRESAILFICRKRLNVMWRMKANVPWGK
jgi:hypothetical protein